MGYNTDDSDDGEGENNGDWVEPALATHVTYDQTTEEAWAQGQYEISIAERNIIQILCLRSKKSYSLPSLSDYVITNMWNQIRSLFSVSSMTELTFKKIILTFYFISSFEMSTTDFFDNDNIIKSRFCTRSEYCNFWSIIHEFDSRPYDVSHRMVWRELLKGVNSLCQNLFLNNFQSDKRKTILIDDDKDHYNGKKGWAESGGLKPTQHVRDNRRGFTYHTLVFTSSGFPLVSSLKLFLTSTATMPLIDSLLGNLRQVISPDLMYLISPT